MFNIQNMKSILWTTLSKLIFVFHKKVLGCFFLNSLNYEIKNE
jgi:hypothetical protein